MDPKWAHGTMLEHMGPYGAIIWVPCRVIWNSCRAIWDIYAVVWDPYEAIWNPYGQMEPIQGHVGP